MLPLIVFLPGCVLEPPLVLFEDPGAAHWLERSRESARIPYGLAVAPVELAFQPTLVPLIDEPAGLAPASHPPQDTTRSFLVSPDRAALHRTIAHTLDTLGMFLRTEALNEAEAWDDEGQWDVARATRNAENRGLRLLLRVTVLSNSVRYVGKAGVVYWLNILNYMTWGPHATWWVPDEIFEVELTVQVEMMDTRNPSKPYRKVFSVGHEEWFNEFMRGFLIAGWARSVGALERENWLRVHDQLAPYAVRALELALIEDFLVTLPVALEQRDMEEGNGRVFAVLIGGQTENADSDVQAMADYLGSHGAEARDISLLTDERKNNGREEILAALRASAGKALRDDLLVVYFSAHGLQQRDGTQESYALLPGKLSEGARFEDYVSLDVLRATLLGTACEHVLFVLDTSFGGSGGRTHGRSQDFVAQNYLRQLADVPGWGVFVAAAPDETAQEFKGVRERDHHGLFTNFLISADLQQDIDGNGRLSVNEIIPHVREQVLVKSLQSYGIEQNPTYIGDREGFELGGPRR